MITLAVVGQPIRTLKRAASGPNGGYARPLRGYYAVPIHAAVTYAAEKQGLKRSGELHLACGDQHDGLLRELNLGPLAPEARIMPLDQAAGGSEPG